MGAKLNYIFLFLFYCRGLSFGIPSSCDEVRKVYQLRVIGPVKLLPTRPKSGSDLQVCISRNLTCCTKKMEERYQVAARRDIQSYLQSSSSSLKFLISRNVAAFQESFEGVMRQAENRTMALLQQHYGGMAAQAGGPVRELFTDAGLFLLGSQLSMEDVVHRFFHALFPLVYGHLLVPGADDVGAGYAECMRSSGRHIRPFGSAPGLLANQMERASVSGKLFLQALYLGIEVINTTDHLQFSRECRRALLKLHYCPHCQGHTQSKPCMGYCLNVMRGCLASMAEIDTHWREFVRSLGGLSSRMQGEHDLEQVLLGVHASLRDALRQAEKNGPRLSAQVHKACGLPSRKTAQYVSIQHHSNRESIPLKAYESGESLSARRKEFLNSLGLYRTYYGGLADQLCGSELASGDGPSCWNGADFVKSYTLQVVANGIKAQTANPEVRVKEADAVINQIIDKLKHINQLLQGKSIPKLGTLDQIETGSGGGEGRYSGDCDDEDGCGGSGGGEEKRNDHRVSKLSPDVDQRRYQLHPREEDYEMDDRSSSPGQLTGSIGALLLTCLRMLL